MKSAEYIQLNDTQLLHVRLGRIAVIRTILQFRDGLTQAAQVRTIGGECLAEDYTLFSPAVSSEVIAGVNAALQRVYGIPIMKNTPQGLQRVSLMEWLGPHEKDPTIHLWNGQAMLPPAFSYQRIPTAEGDLREGLAAIESVVSATTSPPPVTGYL